MTTMTLIKTWIISGWIHAVIGFILGWIVFKRPEWVETIISKVRAKIGF